MKKIVLAASLLIATAAHVQAGSWSLSCTNSSCELAQGAVKIHYSSSDYRGSSVSRVTGISGLPLDAEDFQSQEKALNMTIEKSISKNRSTSASMESGANVGEGASGGGKIGNNSSREIGLNRKKSNSVSQSQGGRVSINHTLGFFLHYSEQGGCGLRPQNSIQRYMCAAEEIMDLYHRDPEELRGKIYGYLFGKKGPELMPDVDMTAKTTPQNNEMQVYKYAALSRAPFAGDNRWGAGYQIASEAASREESRKKFNADFLADKLDLELMLKPGQTAAKLEKAGKHRAAVTKYVADELLNIDSQAAKGINSLADKYLAAFSIYYFSDGSEEESKARFAEALKKNDPAIHKVTVPIDWKSRIITAVAVLAGLLVLVVASWFIKRKEKPAPTLEIENKLE